MYKSQKKAQKLSVITFALMLQSHAAEVDNESVLSISEDTDCFHQVQMIENHKEKSFEDRLIDKSIENAFFNQLRSENAFIREHFTLNEILLNNRLKLSFIKLEAVPPTIALLTDLTTIDLSGNYLTTLPSELGNLLNLKELNCGEWRFGDFVARNKIKEIPPEIGNLCKLEKLDAAGNKIEKLPPEIGKLISLTELNLRDNNIENLESSVKELIHLKKLDLRSNPLKVIFPEIGCLTSLEELLLGKIYASDRNALEILPTEIGHLFSLKVLDLTGNRLKRLPTEIQNLTQLESLKLAENPLETL